MDELAGSPTYGGTVGSFFQVDLDTLGRFVASLQESGDHMESALNALKSMDSTQIGTSVCAVAIGTGNLCGLRD